MPIPMRPSPDTIDPHLAPGAPAGPDDPGVPTPMMAQYIEIKAANPDCLLFYRMGDFYELFFNDAAEASRALGIALTRRGKHLGQDIPMAGVPVAAADEYLSRLIALGHRVAVCEQIEDPAEARKRGSKAVVRRDVVRLVTPGTITEDALLDPGKPNWLVALSRTGGSGPGAEWALAWAELSTGTLRLGPTTPDRLLADLAALEPAEILLPDSSREDPAARQVIERFGRAARFEPAALFEGSTAADRLCRAYRVATLDGFGTFGRAELSAAAALLSYLGATQRAARLALRPPERVETGAVMLIDPATRASLELHRTVSGKRAGSLLAAIDRTVTSAGARLLAARLAWPLTDPAAIRARADAVAFFVENRAARASLREILRGLPDTERALSRLSLDRGGPRDLGTVRAGLDGARLALELLADADLPDEVAGAARHLAALPAALADELERLLAETPPVNRRDGGFVAAGAVSELDEARSLRDRSRAVIAELQARYCTETGVRALKIRYNNVLGYFVEVSEGNSAPLRAMRGADGAPLFTHRQTLASAVRFSSLELADLETRIADAAALALRLELAVFDRLAGSVLAELPALRASAEALAALDVAAALAELAASANWCRPAVDDSLAFRVVGGRHPVVEAALKASGAPFVANDCDLSPPKRADAGAIWLLTGPNMGGKSTFLRQNAIIAVLAQVGAFVPAESAHIGVVDRLFSRVGASDDLAEGRSTFMVEMVETAAILNRAGPRTLVVLDEIGRGTATYDGLSIAFAAVEHLHEVNRARALFATHFHEMTALAKRLKRLRNATVSVKEWDGEVIFLHEVRPGVADRSYGIQVARLAGLPPAVVERAKTVLAQLERIGQRERTAFIDDLPLFSAAAARGPAPPVREASPALDALRALDPDAMSPREAMDALYRLKSLLATGNRS